MLPFAKRSEIKFHLWKSIFSLLVEGTCMVAFGSIAISFGFRRTLAAYLLCTARHHIPYHSLVPSLGIQDLLTKLFLTQAICRKVKVSKLWLLPQNVVHVQYSPIPFHTIPYHSLLLPHLLFS